MLERKTCHFSRKQNNIYETVLFNAFVLFLVNSQSSENKKGGPIMKTEKTLADISVLNRFEENRLAQLRGRCMEKNTKVQHVETHCRLTYQ